MLSVFLCPEGHLPLFSVIQTHLSGHFHLAVDCLGLRRGGSWSQIIDPPQDFPKQVSRHRNLGQLEGNVPAMTDHLRADVDQLLPQRRQRPVSSTSGMGQQQTFVAAAH